MNEKDFTNRVRQMVADYTNEHLDPTDGKRIQPEDVFIVWQCKTCRTARPWPAPYCRMACTTKSPTMATSIGSIWTPTKI